MLWTVLTYAMKKPRRLKTSVLRGGRQSTFESTFSTLPRSRDGSRRDRSPDCRLALSPPSPTQRSESSRVWLRQAQVTQKGGKDGGDIRPILPPTPDEDETEKEGKYTFFRTTKVQN